MNGLICCALGFVMGVTVGWFAEMVIDMYLIKRHEKKLIREMQHMKTGLLLMAYLNKKHRERTERN